MPVGETGSRPVGLIASRSGLGEAAITADDLLVSALRMRPDRIILGEIRGGEATTFLRAVNTGYPGSHTTIHAHSPVRAIDQLALVVLQTGMRMSWDDVVTYVRRSIDHCPVAPGRWAAPSRSDLRLERSTALGK